MLGRSVEMEGVAGRRLLFSTSAAALPWGRAPCRASCPGPASRHARGLLAPRASGTPRCPAAGSGSAGSALLQPHSVGMDVVPVTSCCHRPGSGRGSWRAGSVSEHSVGTARAGHVPFLVTAWWPQHRDTQRPSEVQSPACSSYERCLSGGDVPLHWGLHLCEPVLLRGSGALAPPALLLVISFSLCMSFLLSFLFWAGLEMLCLLFN